MTTDDKTDSKTNQSVTQTETNATTESATNATTDDRSGDQLVTINEKSDQNKLKEESEAKADEPPQDVHMKSAESLESISTSDLKTLVTDGSNESTSEEMVNFKLVFNKTNYDIVMGEKRTGLELKQKIQTLTSVAPAMQKLLLKGIPVKDEPTLKECGIKSGVKLMLIGSTLNDVMAVNSTTKEDIKEEKTQTSTKEAFCKQKQHKKVLERGKPEDVMPAWRNGRAPLPPEPLYGMVNKFNNKVRLTFKLELDQLWIGTKERTDKLQMASIRSIVSEPIEEHPEYHIMGVQTGPTELSRIWIYWVPSQFVDAIKDTILGK
ncbi:ubiquitin domain-containing protein UBFD1-like [Oppia nitens]|uniref:ubiquitin domain-containing protein UBFD1-like n=1 Tax=Oppia nitens TaxID=1686743 RepID=UPI0023DBC9DB|nr:ubiquitin domain-containing protein UBFD1-like [Oppia nitens]XP_054155089.1 ubiquitin domain-containing protein UBFD1-like [Oppia nitens]